MPTVHYVHCTAPDRALVNISVELDSTPREDGTRRVKLVLVKARARARHTIEGVRVKAEQWDAKRSRVKMGPANAPAINARIVRERERAERLAIEHPECTPAELRDALKVHHTPTSGLLIDALRAYHEAHAPRLAYGTRRHRLGILTGYVAKVLPRATLAGFSRADVMALDREILSRNRHRNTRRAILKTLRTMYRGACKDAGVVAGDPFDGLMPGEVKTIKRHVHPPELAILEAVELEGAERLAVDTWLLQYHLGGLRVGEAMRLHYSMLQGGAFRWVEGKVPKPRYHPVGKAAQRIMDRYKGGGYVLPYLEDGMSRDEVSSRIESRSAVMREHLTAVCERLGIPRIKTHNARHTAAQRIKSLTDIHTAKKILGHTNVKQTEAYLDELDNEAVDEAFRKMDG